MPKLPTAASSDALGQWIAELSKLVKQRAGDSEETELPMTIPGASHLHGAPIPAEICDVCRFLDERRLCSLRWSSPFPPLRKHRKLRRKTKQISGYFVGFSRSASGLCVTTLA